MKYTFDDIAGYETEKQELQRLCELFNNREKYQKKGAKLPKGIIFYGEPGTGKTLFSKVMASVCGLEVFKIDLGDVENESVICRHIKKTFLKARKRKEPTMIFFDEMDKVLPNPDERYYTDRSKTILTQLLTSIDGMESSGNIVFVATCNNYSALPSALTRPGRLDKKIGIGSPDYPSRLEILNMYVKKSICRFEMPMEEIAKLCAGFTCSALETLVNECILQSDDDGFISEKVLRERVLEIKNEDIPRRSSVMVDSVMACRNAGAFVVGFVLQREYGELNLETSTVCNSYFNGIIELVDDSYQVCDDDDYEEDYEDDDDYDDNDEEDEMRFSFYSKTDFLNAITVLLGGYVTEEILFRKTFYNVGEDLSNIDSILLRMSKMGMFGLKLRYCSWRNDRLPYAPKQITRLNETFDKTIEECYQKAKTIIVQNEELVRNLMRILFRERYLKKEECEKVVQNLGGIQW